MKKKTARRHQDDFVKVVDEHGEHLVATDDTLLKWREEELEESQQRLQDAIAQRQELEERIEWRRWRVDQRKAALEKAKKRMRRNRHDNAG